MCRNIRVLFHFEPPTTRDEIHAAALQYVRKVSGTLKPTAADRDAFEAAVTEVANVTSQLLGALTPRGPSRTREGEREKGKARWKRREVAMASRASFAEPKGGATRGD
ncbi:MAG: DUF2277 domain-containing protein [Polyangiales bacterium]